MLLLPAGFWLAAVQPALTQVTTDAAESATPVHSGVVWQHASPAADEDAEDDRDFSYGAESDVNSAYIWRGIGLSNKPVFEPSAWISIAGFNFGVEDNELLETRPEWPRLYRTDLTLSYFRFWKKLRAEVLVDGLLNAPRGGTPDPKTAEASLKLSYPLGPFRAFTEQVFDVAAYRGAYFGEAGVSYRRRLRKRTVIDLTARSGWASSKFNEAYIGVRKAALNYLGFDGSLSYYLTHYLYVKPHFEFSDVVDQQLRTQLPWPTIVSCGLAVGVDF